MRTKWLVALLAVGATVLVAPAARADDPDHDLAVAAFEEARKLIDAGDCDGGIAKLRQSLAYEPSVGARLSMADCYEPRDPLEAWRQLREAERLAYVKHDDRGRVAHDRATALETRLALVHIVLPPAVVAEPGLELRLDGVRIDPFFYASGVLAMSEGPHILEAGTPSKKWAQRVVAQQGVAKSVTVRLEDAAPEPAADSPPAPIVTQPHADPGSTQRTIAWVLGGVGIAGVAAGTAFGLAALQKRSDITAACGGNASECSAAPGSLDAEMASQRTDGSASTAAFVVGGAALAGALTLLLTAPHASPLGGRVGLSAGAGRDRASVILSGSW